MGFDKQQVINFRDALKQSGVNSVDAFLEHRRGFLEIGKTAIAESLIPFEDESKLFNLNTDWYGYLLDRLNSPIDRFHENQLTILTFNYDRSLEWYLYKAFQARYRLTGEETIGVLRKIPIIHLYGTLGGLPWEKNGRPYLPTTEWPQAGVMYGPMIIFGINSARGKIKIIHEEHEQDPEFNKAIEMLSKAKRIVFLGFGYNKVNIKRLSPHKWTNVEHPILGTAFGRTELESHVARRDIAHNTEFGKEEWDILRFLRERIDFEAR
ncbi:MAG: hypothetical protein HYR76_14030 [Ignavibacteria bacterium]|nr:hypothetical protein [Ignavibacteria bacterium]